MSKNPFSSFCKGFIEENQKSIVLLLFLISIIGAVAGYRYYRYTKDDPAFCMSCHMMQEAYRSWEKSKHWNYPCQRCHAMSVLEQNRMLIDYVLKETGKAKQRHGRISPWEACKSCHLSDVEQGSITLNNSYGHAKHVFMQKIPCSRCHMGGPLHTFAPNEQACLGCHADKSIHGLGMAGFSCLKCHSYSEKAPKMISNDRCLSCHKNFPRTGPMSSLKCFDCHHPHGQIKPTNNDCLKKCHGYETKVGQHNLHMTKAKLQCLDCHKAHTWVVGTKEARTLCTRCHALKAPATFID